MKRHQKHTKYKQAAAAEGAAALFGAGNDTALALVPTPAELLAICPAELLRAHSQEPTPSQAPTPSQEPTHLQAPTPSQVPTPSQASTHSQASGEYTSLACVVRLDRGFPACVMVAPASPAAVRAEFSAELTAQKQAVAVGDWVRLRVVPGHDKAIIEAVYPRSHEITRWKGSSRGLKQVLAANISLVLIASPLDALDREEVLSVLLRIVRLAVIARDAGCACAVVLTKADSAPAHKFDQLKQGLRDVLGPDLCMVCTSQLHEVDLADFPADTSQEPAVYSDAINQLKDLIARAGTAIILGTSGAGKSTLTNVLAGAHVLDTASVRKKDKAGRHTTVARRMIALPSGGILVDAPGLRSTSLLGHQKGFMDLFGQVIAYGADCKFRDCTHTHEPGCAVRQACAEGHLSTLQVQIYVEIAKDLQESQNFLDPDIKILPN